MENKRTTAMFGWGCFKRIEELANVRLREALQTDVAACRQHADGRDPGPATIRVEEVRYSIGHGCRGNGRDMLKGESRFGDYQALRRIEACQQSVENDSERFRAHSRGLRDARRRDERGGRCCFCRVVESHQLDNDALRVPDTSREPHSLYPSSLSVPTS